MVNLAILYLQMDGHFLHMLLSSVQAYMIALFSLLNNNNNLKYLWKREILLRKEYSFMSFCSLDEAYIL